MPTTANTRTYIEIVQEKATLRKLIAASQTISRQCYAQTDPVPDVLRDAERLIFDIVMRRGGAETLEPIQKVLLSTFDRIEELSLLKGKLAGVPTGLYDLDRMLTGLHGGELVLVGARPAMGKTSMALGVTLFAAQKAPQMRGVFQSGNAWRSRSACAFSAPRPTSTCSASAAACCPTRNGSSWATASTP